MSLPLLYPQTLGQGCVRLNLPSCYHISLTIKEFKTHARTHHVALIVINALSTLCYSTMPHAPLILCYHASMLTLQTSLKSHGALVATCVMLGKLKCRSSKADKWS